jgi:hypothetical protein
MKRQGRDKMPNWVHQTVTITGSEFADEIAKVKEQVSKPYVNKWADKNYNHQTDTWEFVSLKEETVESPFSFWNIIKPADELLDEYYGVTTKSTLSEGLSILAKVAVEMATSNGWYEWNCRNWGSKWNACDIDVTVDEPTHLTYVYNTAWSPSLEAIQELSRQYPNLTFSIDYVEEQGWGGERSYKGGEVTYSLEYDIPESHAEVEERGNECFCYADDYKPFADCPTA